MMAAHRAPLAMWSVVLFLRGIPTATSVQVHQAAKPELVPVEMALFGPEVRMSTNMSTPSYPAEPYCYYVNGVCFIWASPCSGVVWCSELAALSTYDWFCPWGLRYATQSEWDAANTTLDANRDTFFQKCAASQLDPRHDHCDYYNTFVREPDNSYNELVLVCPPAGTATPSPTPSPTVARPAEDYCYYVNGVCFIWASPCSGVVWCSDLNALSTYDWFCPSGLRYATQLEWDSANTTLDANRDTFFQKCAASQLDPRHDHCDYYNTFVREPDNSYNELVLVCPPPGTATPSPTPSPTATRPAEDYCYYVNGVCFIWASPCSGVVWCSELAALSTYDWFCPSGLRYATQSEWDAAISTLDSNRDTFFQKCAASQLDPRHDHCDYYNNFAREPDNSYNEQILVCPPVGTATPSPTPSPTLSSASAQPSPTPSPTYSPLPAGGTNGRPAEDYCYYVNGVCFIWASPCSGVVWCSELAALSTYDWFCPSGLRYATQSEWDAANTTLDANRDTFFQKCAAGQLDPRHDHCDYYNTFVREPDNSYNELVLVCPPAGTPTASPTPSPTPSSAGSPTAGPTPSPTYGPLPSGGTGGVGATGDPHLQNVHGQRFDLMKPGKHVLINIPRGQRAEYALLRVQAYARRLGGCTDMYFQELNVTGSWAEFQQAGGYRYTVSDPDAKKSEWLAFEKVELKVVHGRTKRGLKYLNFYVKHLSKTGFTVGGLLGEDDHTQVTIPTKECSRRVALMEVTLGTGGGPKESSVAEASLE